MTSPDTASPTPKNAEDDAPDATDELQRGDGETHVTQDGEPVPHLPHERDQTTGSQGSQDKPDDDTTRDDKTGISKRAYDDAVGPTEDTSLSPVTDEVYNGGVKP